MPENAETPLQGWKEIASHLERDERTARRWEKEENLPIRRHRTEKRSSVYAYPSELEQWRVERPTKVAEAAADEADGWTSQLRASRPWVWTAVAATFVLGGFVLFLRSPGFDPIAEAGAAGSGVKTVEVCADCDILGDLSPDGRYLSVTDWSSGNGDVAIRDLETGETRRLTNNHKDSDEFSSGDRSVFSPDGEWLAYNWDAKDASGEFQNQLRIISTSAAQREPRTVLMNPEFRYISPHAWTDDGRLLITLKRQDWSESIAFVSVETGELTVLKSFENKSWARLELSPDERWIAYHLEVDPEDLTREAFLLASDGSQERVVVPHPANETVMGFTPDSRTLLIASNRTGANALWGVDIAEGSEPRLLLRDFGAVRPISVAADGALWYARSVGSNDLFSAELDWETGRVTRKPRLLETQYRGSNNGPSFSPDESRLAYFATPNYAFGMGSFYKPSLQIRVREGGEERSLRMKGFDLASYYGLRWSPDGNRILTAFRDRQGNWGLCEINLATDQTRIVLGPRERLAWPLGWTADGKGFLYSLSETVDNEPVRAIEMLVDGEEKPRRIHNDPDRILWGSLSPQRDRIAWRAPLESSDQHAIKILPVEGGQAEIAFRAPEGYRLGSWNPAWAPDGRSLLIGLFRGNSGSELGETWIIPLDGSDPRRTDLSARGLRGTVIGLDGKTVYFQGGDRDKRIFKTENYLPPNAESTE